MKRLALPLSALALALACLMFLPKQPGSAPQASGKEEKQSPPPAESAPEESPLFPDLSPSAVSSLRVSCAERSFCFQRRDGGVSVNGKTADAEAFGQLVEQIVSLPVRAAEERLPGGSPKVSLQMTAGATQIDVDFYTQDERGTALVVCRALSPAARLTDAWRLGTLLLACDGTRILDEQGRETPSE